MEPASKLAIPELSDSDLQWLHEKIGIQNLNDNEWKSKDYVRAIEDHLDRNQECSLSVRNMDGNTPLHLVAISENYAAIEGLLMCGAGVNEENNSGNTPITFSHHCPDYNVGFQFFRHLHKLAFLGQFINRTNSIWKYDVERTYNQRYPRNGYLTAFMHNPSLTEQTICKIGDGGIDVIYQMYEYELDLIENTPVGKIGTLSKMVNLTDRLDVAENRLKRLRKFTNYKTFHESFPLFGFMIKHKYWQSSERLKLCKLEDPDDHKSDNRPSCAREVAPNDYDQDELAKQRRKELQAHEKARLFGVMNDLAKIKNMDQQRAVHDCSSSDSNKVQLHDFNDQINKTELSNDEKVERLRKLMAKLPRPGSQS